jgi:hypothetical protein
MPKAVKRKPAKRGTMRSAKRAAMPRGGAHKVINAADFCAAARDALKRGEPDAISDKMLQQVLTAAVKIYAAKVERRGYDVVPFPQHAVTATETVVTACGIIRAADLNMFDVAIWFHRPQGIE